MDSCCKVFELQVSHSNNYYLLNVYYTNVIQYTFNICLISLHITPLKSNSTNIVPKHIDKETEDLRNEVDSLRSYS